MELSGQGQIERHSETLRNVLKSQYHAALAMLGEAIERCPDHVWRSDEHVNSFWQIAYHTLYFTHLYLQPDEATSANVEEAMGRSRR